MKPSQPMSEDSAGRCIDRLIKFAAVTTTIKSVTYAEMTMSEIVALVAWGEKKDFPQTITMQETLDLFHAEERAKHVSEQASEQSAETDIHASVKEGAEVG